MVGEDLDQHQGFASCKAKVPIVTLPPYTPHTSPLRGGDWYGEEGVWLGRSEYPYAHDSMSCGNETGHESIAPVMGP